MSKGFLAILVIAITVNVAFFLFYTYRYFKTYNHVGHRVHINNILGIILVSVQTPESKLKERINGVGHSNIEVSYTKHPRFKLQFHHQSVESIERKLLRYYTKNRYIRVSYSYKNNNWINISIDKRKISYSRFLSTPVLIAIIGLGAQTLLVFIILSYFIATRKFRRTLKEIREGAGHLGVSLKDVDALAYGPYIAGEAISTLKLLQGRIKELIVERVATLAGLSHDIKTPLTRVKLMLDLQKNMPRSQNILNEIGEIEYLIDRSLSYARSDYKSEEKHNIDIVSLIETICHDEQDMDSQVVYTSDVKKYIINGQENGLRRAFKNLISNALHYADAAKVLLKMQNNKLLIEISDTGPGIPEDKIKSVFSPFFRCDHTKGRNPKGCGLGLSIAKAAIVASNGSIELSNLKPHGLLVQIVF